MNAVIFHEKRDKNDNISISPRMLYSKKHFLLQ